jgi:tRNA A-37 threonylcarbamoyl transferase component Bud32
VPHLPLPTISGIEGLLAGRTLASRYRIDEVIGRGGMGAVYRARDSHLGREVAVKVITVAAPDRASHERLRARFHREARAAAALHHPCVVAVHDFGTDPELCLDFIVMELLRGEDLSDRLERKGAPALPTSLSIVEQAARGLAAGHRAGLIHRDVKPGNIFLETGDRVGEVRVKILDFGIAELTTSDGDTATHLTVYGRSPFSPAFASPEQLRGDPRLTPATDVFSLGAVAFQLLTGRRLFSTSEHRQMLVELSETFAQERPRLNAISPEITGLLERALAPAAADRFADAGQFADLLNSTPREIPRSYPTPAPDPPRRVDPDDHTRLLDRGTETRVAERNSRFEGAMEGVRHGPLVAEGAPAAVPARQPHWIRRAGAALWSFILTAGATAFFAWAWIAAFTGVENGDVHFVYGGAAASILATPVALHRLMGSRGSIGLVIFGSLAATLGCVYWLGQERMELVLGAVFGVQIVASVAIEKLTTGRTPARPYSVDGERG